MGKSKKEFKSGIEALLSPTTNNKSISETDNKQTQIEKLTSVMFRIPVNVKIQMEHYCTDNRIKQQELIINAIKKYIDEK
jgi:hypothetical protein